MSSPFEELMGQLRSKVGGTEGTLGKLAPALTGLLSGGGLHKLVSQFTDAGLGKHADSWVGTGKNEPITADHVKQALSEGQIGEVAQTLGVSKDQAAATLAETLPEAVSHLTPAGRLPDQAEIDKALRAPAAAAR